MNRNNKVMKAQDIYDNLLELRALEKKLESEKQQLFKEKKEIEDLKQSVSYLKLKYEKSLFEENSIIETPELSALKVHLFASRAERISLRNKVQEFNKIFHLSPYAFIKYNIDTGKVNWASNNFKSITGYDPRELFSEGISLMLKKPLSLPDFKDGLILNYPAIFKHKKARVDLFIHNYENLNECLLGFHDVSERTISSKAS